MKKIKFALLVAAASSAMMTASLPAATSTYYWDVNGATLGATDDLAGIAQGVWNNSATSPYWNSDLNGGAGTLSFKTTTADEARFSAGVNATGAFLVYVAGDSANTADGETIDDAKGSDGHTSQNGQQNIGRIFFEEGAVTLKKGIIYLGNAFTLGVGQQALISNNSTASATILSTLKGASDGLTIGGTGRTIFGVDNIYTGATTIASGATLQIQSTQALSTTAVTVQSGGTLELAGGVTTFANATTLNGTGVGNGGALRAVSGSTNIYTGAITLGAGGARINADTGELRLTGGITGGGNSLTVGGAGNTRIMTTAMNLGAGGLNKDGAGTLFLTMANTYTGATSITGGNLNISNGGALGTSSPVTVAGGTLQLQGGITVNRPLNLSGTGSNNNGAIQNIIGNNTLSGAITLANATRINSDAGLLTVSGAISGAGQNLTVGGAGNTTIATAFNIGSGSLLKDGSGTLTLNTANTLTAATPQTVNTVVSNGRLTLANVNSLNGAAGGAIKLGDDATGANNVELRVQSIGDPNSQANRLMNNIRTGAGTGAVTITLGGASGIGTDGPATTSMMTLDRATTLKLDNSFAVIGANITGNVGALSIVSTGAGNGSLFLRGNNNYTGTTIVGDGDPTHRVNLYVDSVTGLGVGNALVINEGSYVATFIKSTTFGAISGSGNLLYLQGNVNPGQNAYTIDVAAGSGGVFSGKLGGTLVGSGYPTNPYEERAKNFNIFKTGAGIQVLSGVANDYNGNGQIGTTSILGGILEIKKIANGGAVSSIGSSSNSAVHLVLNGGTLRYTGVGATDGITDRLFTLGAGGGTLDASAASVASPLQFTNAGNVGITDLGNRTLTLAGSNTGTNTLAVALTNGSSTNGTSVTVPAILGGGLNQFRVPSTTNVTVGASVSGLGLAAGTVVTGVTSDGASGVFVTVSSNRGAGGNVTFSNAVYAMNADPATSNNYIRVASTVNIAVGTIVSGAGIAPGSTVLGVDTTTVPGVKRLLLSRSLTATPTGNVTVGVSSGVTSLLKSGTGTWVVSGNNTYTGDTLVNAGTLRLDYAVRDGSKLSDTGTLRLGGGTVEITRTAATLGTHNEVVGSTELRLNSKSTITRTGGATGTIALGAITPLTGSALNIVTDDLAATSTVASTTTANGADGILGGWCTMNGTDFAMNSGVAGPVGTTGNYIRAFAGLTQVADGGTIGDNGNLIWSMNDSSTNSGNGGTTPTNGDAIVLSAATTNVSRISQDQISGGITVVNIAAGQTLRLGVTGGILMGAGANVLILGTAPDIGNLSAGGATANTAGTLYLDNSSVNLLTVNSKVIDNGTGAVTVAKAGSGKVVLTGTNTYTGATVVTQGVLGFDDQAALGSSSTVATNLVLSGGVLQYTGTTATTSNRLFSVSTTNGGIDSASVGGSIVFSNIGAMGFNGQSGSRTLTLSGTNTNDNTLAASIGDNNGATSLVKGGGTVFSGGTTGVGGVWLLSGSNTYSGGTTVNDGTLKAGIASVFTTSAITSGAFGTGGLGIASGATVNLNGFDTATGNLSGAGRLLLGANKFATGFDSTNTIFSGVISDGGQLEKDGQGTLTLSGANTYTGATTVNGGVLRAGVATIGGTNPTSGAFGVNSAVTVGAAGTLDLNGFNETLGSLAGQGRVTLGAGNLLTGNDGTSTVFNGILSGSGNVTKVGVGTWSVNGVSTYTGTTTVSEGAIRMQGAQALGTNTTASAVTVASGAALELDGGFTTAGAQPLTISGDGTSASTGAMRNITGNNTWTGLVTLAGDSRINSDADKLTLASGQNLVIDANTLTAGGAGELIIARTITGTGGLTVDGTGTVTIDGANGGSGAYTGTTKVSGGTLRLLYGGANDLLNASSSLNMNGGTVVFENLGTNTQAFASTTITAGTALAPSRLVLGAGRTTGSVNLGNMSQQNIFSMDVSNMGYDPTKSWVKINNAPGVLNITTDYGITGNNGVDVLSSDATGRLFIALTDDYSREGQISTGAVTARLIQTGLGTNIDGRAISLVNPTTTATTEIQSLQNSYTLAAAVPDDTIRLYLRAGGTRLNNYADGQNGTLRLGASNSVLPVNSSITSTAGTNLLIDYGNLTVGGYATLGGLGSSGGNISFNTAADTLDNGGLITLGTSLVIADNSAVVGTNAVSISKIGTGTLTIKGANTYSGLTTVSAGVLNLQSNGGLGGTANGTTVAAGAALQLQNNITVTGEALSLGGTGMADDGALRNISGANTYAADITLTSATRINSDAGTLTLSGAIGGSGQNLTLGGAGDTVVSGAIGTGTGSLTKDGAGTLTLTVANTYTGGTAINGGVLEISDNNQLGASGDMSFDGGTLRTLAAITSDRAITLNAGGGTVDTNLAGSNLSGGITGGGVLTATGGGTLTLSGSSNYTGGTVVNGGTTVVVGANSNLGDSIATLTLDNGVLQASAGFTSTHAVTLAGAGTVDTGAFTVIQSAGIDGTGALTKTGAGTLSLTADATHTGGTTIDDGTLEIGTGGSLTGDVTNNATLAFNHTTTLAYGGTISGSGVVNQTGTGTTTLTGTNTYADATNVTAGALYINGDQTTAVGLTTVSAGTLGGMGTIGGSVVVANGATLSPGDNSTAPGTLTINGALTLNDTSRLAYSFGQAGVVGGSLNDLVNVGGNLTLNGVLDVTLAPGGTFGPGIYRIMNYTGALNNGTLDIGVVPAGASVSDLFVQTSVLNEVNLVNSAGLTLQFWDGALTGSKNDNVVQGGDGVWQASGAGANDNWTVASGTPNAPYAANAFAIFQGAAGDVRVDSATFGAVRSSGMQFVTSGYTLVANAGGDKLTLVETTAGSGMTTIKVGDGTAIGAATTTTIDVELTGSSGLSKEDLGTLVLSGTNTYMGGTAIKAGTLVISNNLNLGALAGGLSFDTGTLKTLAAVTSNRVVTLDAGGGIVDTNGFDSTLGGTVDGSGSITKIGAGVLTLGGTSTYAGGTVINGGVLAISTDANLGATSGVLSFDGGTLRTLADLTSNRAITLNAGGGTVDTNALNSTLGGVLSGGGALTKVGAGTLSLTGSNTYTGLTTVSAGTLQVGDGGSSGSLAGNVLNDSVLAFNRNDALTHGGVIGGSGIVNQVGTGTTTLTGTNSYTGATNVQSGSLFINGDQSGAAGLTTVSSGATLGGSGTIGGSVDMLAGGTLTPGADAGATGVLTINGGLALGSTSNLKFSFGQPDVAGGPLNDLVNVGGDLTLDGTIDVSQTVGGSFGPGLYRIFNYTGSLTDKGLTVASAPVGNLADVYVQTSAANRVNLVNTTGLSFNYWDGAAGPKYNGAVNGGDGVWQRTTSNENWANSTGTVNGPYLDSSFAIFQAAPGTVAVNTTTGAVNSAGMQFAVGGYTITGDELTLVGTQAVIRVGDGTGAGAAMTATIDSVLGGGAQLVKTDLGTLVLSGTNTYTGGTSFNGGVLAITADANLGAISGALSFDGGTLKTLAAVTTNRAVTLNAGGGTVDTNGFDDTLGGAIGGVGGLTKAGAGTLSLTGANTYSGLTTVTTGTLQIGGGATSGSLTGNVLNNSVLAFNRSDSLTYSGVINGTGAVNQVGDGDTILTGANAYTGTTNINAGGLYINGDQTSAVGLTTVNNGGTLGGTGTIGGSVVVADGATLAPGSNTTMPGVFTVNGNLSLNNASILAYSFGQSGVVGGPLNDLVNVSGNLTLDGVINVTLAPGGTFDLGVYRIMNYTGSLTDSTLTVGAVPGGVPSNVFVQTSVDKQVNLVNTAGLSLRFWDGATDPVNDPLLPGGTRKNNSRIEGGDGVWQNNAGNDNWTESGVANAPYTNDAFAVFQGTAGTVKVDSTTFGPVTSIGMQFAVSGYTINNNTGSDSLTLTGAQAVIRVGDGSATSSGMIATISATLGGGAQLVKTDLGTLVLGGVNSYTGGTAINGGTLAISNDNNLGDSVGDLSFNGGTLRTDGSIASTRDIIVNALGGTVNTNTFDSGFDGEISGSGLLTLTGGDVVTLGGANTNTGGLVVNGGTTVAITSDSNLGGALNVLTLDNGTLRTDAAITATHAIAIAAGNGTVDTNGSDIDLNGEISGPGHLMLTGGNVVSLGGANTNTGGLAVINGTTVAVTSDGNLGGASNVLTLDNGTLRAGAAFTSTHAMSLEVGNGTVDTNGFTFVQGGDIGGAGTLTKTGAGTLTLTGSATHSGLTTVAAGTLRIGNGGTSGSLAGDVLLGSTTASLDFERDGSLTHGGLIGGTGVVNQMGSGDTILTASNTYTGLTNINSGGLFINGDQTAAIGLTTVSSGATLGGSGTIGGSVDMTAGGTLAPGSTPGTIGALAIKGNLTLASGTTLAYGLGAPNVVGGPLNDLITVTGNLTLDGTINVTESATGAFAPGVYRVFDYAGTLTNNGLAVGSVPAGSNAAQVFVQTTLANQVNLVNASGLTLRFWDGDAGGRNDSNIAGGNGTWQNVLGNENWTTETGSANAPFTDSAFAVFQAAPGVVSVDNGQGPVTVSGMQFAVDGYSVVGDDLTLTGTQAVIRVGDGSINDNAKTATISAKLLGTAELVKTDAGTLVLSAANAYLGGTAINGGVLAISSDSNLGDTAGALSFDGGTLRTDAAIGTNRVITLNAGDGTVDANGFDSTLGGAIGGSGGLTKSGIGTLVLTADNNYAGATTISGGTLRVGSGGSSGSLGTGDVTNNSALVFDRSDTALDVANVIHGAGTVTKAGTGTVTLSGTSDYIGATNVDAGVLAVTGNLGNTTVTVASGATLTGSGSIAGTVDIVSSGHLANTQGATLTMGSLSNAVTLAAGANTDVTLSAASTTALFSAKGNLTLNGSLNITGTGAFGGGVYRLFDYTGTLTDGGFSLGLLTPPSGSGITLSDLYIDTSHAGEVNLINTYSVLRNVWDGSNDIDHNNGSVQGGSGEWNASATNRNWTNDDIAGGLSAGAVNNTFGAGAPVAVFLGTPGPFTVTVNEAFGVVQASGLQFETTGYTITGDAITLVNDATTGVALLKTDPNVTATLGSVLQGSANVVKLGTGTMVLTADNTYSGTTTVSAGTLQIGDGGASGSLGSGAVVNDASLVFNRSGAYTVANAISGSGTVTNSSSGPLTLAGAISGSNSLVQSAGTIVLTGMNSYTGTTAINTGTTLQVGDGGTVGALGTGAVTNDGTLIFNRSDSYTVAGQIFGSGELIQRGSGTTILGSNSTYDGLITIEDGVLQVGSGANAGATITGTIDVKSGAQLTFNRSDATLVSATITGVTDSQLIQDGTGKTTLTGDTSGFTGQTVINHGILELNTDAGPTTASLGPVTINADGTLMGTGNIRGPLHNFGTLSIGHSPGSLNVIDAGSFTGDFINHVGSFYNQEIGGLPASGIFDVLNVSGTATIEGGALDVLSYGGFAPVADPSARYRILNAGNVVLTDGNNDGVSGFDNVVGGELQNDNFAALRVMVEYGANFVDLYFLFDGLKPTAELLGLSHNRIAVASALDDAALANPAFGALITEVGVLDNDGFARALASLSPQCFERLWDNTRYNAVMLNNAVESRLQAWDRIEPEENFWMQAIRRVSQVDGDLDLSNGSMQGTGVIIGADTTFGANFAGGDKLTVGAMFEYSNDDIDMGAGSRSRSNHYLPGLYARYRSADFFVEAVGSWGYADYTSKRRVEIGSDVRIAKGRTESVDRTVSVRVGREFRLLEDELDLRALTFTPYVGFMHTRWEADGFTENGAGPANLSVHDMKAESTVSRLGVQFNAPMSAGYLIMPKLDLAWRHEFQQSRRDITANFGPSPLTVRTMLPAVDGLEAKVGLDVRISPRTTVYVDVGSFWDGSKGHSEEYRIGVNMKF